MLVLIGKSVGIALMVCWAILHGAAMREAAMREADTGGEWLFHLLFSLALLSTAIYFIIS